MFKSVWQVSMLWVLCVDICVIVMCESWKCLSYVSWYCASHICSLHLRDPLGTMSTLCMCFDHCCRLLLHPKPRHVTLILFLIIFVFALICWFWDCSEICVSMACYIKFVWRIQRSSIGTVLCCIVYCNCAWSQACWLCVCAFAQFLN